jgi:aminocarboxymuconate-semialdehyde decarboxylase
VIIDAHAHAIPPVFVDYLTGSGRGRDVGIETIGGERVPRIVFGDRTTAPLNPSLSDLDARITWMDDVGIDRQVLAGWIDLTGYEIDRLHAVNYSRAHNDALADYAAQYQDRFWTIGTVPLQDPDAAARELEHLMITGFKGIEIATTVGGAALDTIALDAVWEVAEATGAFVLLHPMTPLTGIDLGRYFMDNAVGRPAETSITLAGLILSGVFERFPRLRLCAVHGGGFVPFQIGRLDQAVKAKPALAGKHLNRLPSEYLRQIYVDTVVHDPHVLRFVVDYLGAEHVLLGTDYPFAMGDLDPLTTIRAVPDLSANEVASIAGLNTAGLCGHNHH